MQMLDILIDNIFIKLSGQVFQQTIYIQMGTYCAPKLFLHAYETGVLISIIRFLVTFDKARVVSNNFMYMYLVSRCMIQNDSDLIAYYSGTFANRLLRIPTYCTIRHILLVPCCVGLDRFHCNLLSYANSLRIDSEMKIYFCYLTLN